MFPSFSRCLTQSVITTPNPPDTVILNNLHTHATLSILRGAFDGRVTSSFSEGDMHEADIIGGGEEPRGYLD